MADDSASPEHCCTLQCSQVHHSSLVRSAVTSLQEDEFHKGQALLLTWALRIYRHPPCWGCKQEGAFQEEQVLLTSCHLKPRNPMLVSESSEIGGSMSRQSPDRDFSSHPGDPMNLIGSPGHKVQVAIGTAAVAVLPKSAGLVAHHADHFKGVLYAGADAVLAGSACTTCAAPENTIRAH